MKEPVLRTYSRSGFSVVGDETKKFLGLLIGLHSVSLKNLEKIGQWGGFGSSFHSLQDLLGLCGINRFVRGRERVK
jgi:hypothetical protein